MFRRKVAIGGVSQSSSSRQYSQVKSFDCVRGDSTLTNEIITSTSPCVPEDEIPRRASSSTEAARKQRLEKTRSTSTTRPSKTMTNPPTIPEMPAIDEDTIFTTSEKIRLTAPEETLLGTLFCRVQDARSAQPVLRDPYAGPTLDRCAVDRSRRSTDWSQVSVAAQDAGNNNAVMWAAHRARTLDDWCVDFVNSHGGDGPVTVVHLGCGLDGRYLRVRDRLVKRLGDVYVSFGHYAFALSPPLSSSSSKIV